jgi:tetratricopeptide (TPR) repeat protein
MPLVVLGCIFLFAVALLAWQKISSGDVALLTARPPAQWILFPKSQNGGAFRDVEMSTVFRREFKLSEVPDTAILGVRGMTRWQVDINGQVLANDFSAGANWKQPSEYNVARALQPGSNCITATVFNSNGPPVLWLDLRAGNARIVSQTNWDASIWGSVWRKAAVATESSDFPKGNPLYGGEKPVESFTKNSVPLAIFAGISFLIVLAGNKLLEKMRRSGPEFENRFCALVLLAVTAIWVLLYWHNLRLLPYQAGFDALDHLAYINRLRESWRLPLANEGWQMYQPPLYYIISAALLNLFHAGSHGGDEILLLRCLGCFIGLLHVALILLSLRLLFPGRTGMQIFGLVLAAFVPEQLYICQFVSNEALCGMLSAGTIYVCLRILKSGTNSPWWHLLLGLLLGLAMLTKFTALLLFPATALAMAALALSKGQFRILELAWKSFIVFATALGVCGWHYWRVWRVMGTPMVANWDSSSGYIWWMEPGFHTPSYFFHFGKCLVSPWFSGFDSFADGLYSTFWGDGLWGGLVAITDRMPWNYDLMASGYLFALFLTAVILLGLVLGCVHLIRKVETPWLFLVAFLGTCIAALAWICLKVPTYGSAKSFYALIALLPLAAFGAVGWEFISRRFSKLAPVAAFLVGVWAINCLASFWINGNSSVTHITLGRMLKFDDRTSEAAREYAKALELDPISARAKCMVGSLLEPPARSIAALEEAVKMDPRNSESHSRLGLALAESGQTARAINEDRLAADLAPETAGYYAQLCRHYADLRQYDEALAVARHGLAVAPSEKLFHYYSGMALLNREKPAEAIECFSHAADLDPKWPDALDKKGLCLQSLFKWEEAAAYFRRASELKPDNDEFHYHLAVATQSAGDSSAAIAELRQSLRLNSNSVSAMNELSWILSTSPDEKIRDGEAALALAKSANALVAEENPQLLGTLAAAYAETGSFDAAVMTANRAIEIAQEKGLTNLAGINRKLIENYRQKKPWREESQTTPAP